MKKGFNKKKYSIIAAASAVVLMIVIILASLAVTGKLRLPEKKQPTTTAPSVIDTDPTERPDDDESQVAFQKPERMQAVWISAGVDYFITGKEDYASVCKQVDAAIKAAAGYNMNTLIVPTVANNKTVFAKNGTLQYILSDKSNDVFDYILKSAKSKGMFVYPVYSLQTGGFDPSVESGMTSILNNVKNLVSSYEFSGILFDDYYFKKTDAAYSQFQQTGGFDSYDTYKINLTATLINRAVTAAKQSGANLYCGIAADAVYAKLVKNPNGIESTGYAYEALTDGFCDTLSVVKKNIVNFVLVKNYCSLTDESARFDRVFKWWQNAVSGTNTDLYIGLSASNSGDSSKAGWSNPDQLVKQLKSMEGQTYNGVSFDSIKKMADDKTGSTEVLIKYLNSTVAANDLVLRDLSITSPSKNTFTTYESKFSLVGASDPNFPITLNGSTFERTEQGYFSLQLSLKSGENKFVIVHKGATTTITATYKVVLIKEVSPSKDQTLDGAAQIMVSAVAKKGSKVTAKLGSTTVNMAESASDNEDNPSAGNDSEFVRYTATINVPKETSSVQKLGKIAFTATLSGNSETVYGGAFTIKAKQPATTSTTTTAVTTSKPTTTTAHSSSSGGSSGGTTPSTTKNVMDTSNVVTGGKNTIAQVTAEQAELFKGNVVDDRSRPVYNYMPMGTLDYCGSSDIINYDDGALIYRKLNTGNSDGLGVRIYKKDIKILTGTLPSTNSVTARSVAIADRHTVITIDSLWKAPVYVEWLPQSYSNPNASSSLNAYSVSSVTCKYIDITFAYAVSGQGKLDLSSNPLFSSAEWIKSGSNYKLRLNLRKTGKFYGFTANYNNYGQLVFKFLNPANIKTASNSYGYSLAGTVIMIDPGHGGGDSGAVGSNKNYPEDKLNLMLSQEVCNELKSIGATVVMTRTTDTEVSLVARAEQNRKVLPDIFVSIHRNSSTNTSAKGYDSYYFYPFSKPLAQSIYDQSTTLFTKRSVNYYPFYVTRVTECPSVLTENGFVSNATELANLINSDFNKKQAKAITQGIVNYFKAQ